VRMFGPHSYARSTYSCRYRSRMSSRQAGQSVKNSLRFNNLRFLSPLSEPRQESSQGCLEKWRSHNDCRMSPAGGIDSVPPHGLWLPQPVEQREGGSEAGQHHARLQGGMIMYGPNLYGLFYEFLQYTCLGDSRISARAVFS
jgi:hypothetical protein